MFFVDVFLSHNVDFYMETNGKNRAQSRLLRTSFLLPVGRRNNNPFIKEKVPSAMRLFYSLKRRFVALCTAKTATLFIYGYFQSVPSESLVVVMTFLAKSRKFEFLDIVSAEQPEFI